MSSGGVKWARNRATCPALKVRSSPASTLMPTGASMRSTLIREKADVCSRNLILPRSTSISACTCHQFPLDIQGLLNGGGPPDELEHGSFGGPEGLEHGLAVHVLVGHVFAGGGLGDHLHGQAPQAHHRIVQPLGRHPDGHKAMVAGGTVRADNPAAQLLRNCRHLVHCQGHVGGHQGHVHGPDDDPVLGGHLGLDLLHGRHQDRRRPQAVGQFPLDIAMA